MKDLQNLIEKLCPEGVEYKPLKDVCDFNRGKTITSKTAVKGDIPVVAGGRKPAYYHNTPNREGATIVVAGSGAYAGYVSYWEQPIFVSDAFSVDIKNNDELNIKYLYYVLKNMQNQIYNMKSGGGVPHVYGKDLAPILIPMPSIPVQEEIVTKLDTFTTMIETLQKTVILYQKQYEYYRNQLLTFEPIKE